MGRDGVGNAGGQKNVSPKLELPLGGELRAAFPQRWCCQIPKRIHAWDSCPDTTERVATAKGSGARLAWRPLCLEEFWVRSPPNAFPLGLLVSPQWTRILCAAIPPTRFGVLHTRAAFSGCGGRNVLRS